MKITLRMAYNNMLLGLCIYAIVLVYSYQCTNASTVNVYLGANLGEGVSTISWAGVTRTGTNAWGAYFTAEVVPGEMYILSFTTEQDFGTNHTPDLLYGEDSGYPGCYISYVDGAEAFWDGAYSRGDHIWELRHYQGIVMYFDVPQVDGNYTLQADGQSMAHGYVSPPNVLTPPITWTIESTNDLGCSINSSNGTVTAGTNVGTIIIRATDSSSPPCYVEQLLELVNCDNCGSSEGCSIGTVEANNEEGVSVFIPLGRGNFGETVGGLTIHEAATSSNLYTPHTLNYDFIRNNVDAVRTNGVLRQVKAPQGLADITTNSASKYYIDFYGPSNVLAKVNGLYGVTNSYFCRVTVENPETSTTNKVRITEARNGNSTVFDYEWADNGWKLNSGGGLRVETVSTTWTNTNTVRIVSRTIQHGTDNPVLVRTDKYQIFSWGQGLVESVSGVGSLALTNSTSYTTNGYLDLIVRSDGSWTKYLYDSGNRPTNVFSAFGLQGPSTNKSSCRMTEYIYSTNVISGSGDNGALEPRTPRCTIDYLLGKEIGRTYTVVKPGERREIRSMAYGTAANWTNGDNLVTITKSYTNGFFKDKVQSITRPDGTMEIYQYSRGTNLTNVVFIGQPDDQETNVVAGTKNITVLGPMGQKLIEASIDVESGITNSFQNYEYDADYRVQKVSYLDGTFEGYGYSDYDCCHQSTYTNREGTVTTYGYDDLKRLVSTKFDGVTTSNVLDAAGQVLAAIRIGTNDSKITVASYTYDTAGRKLTSTNALGHGTTYEKTLPPLTCTTTYPDNSSRVESYGLDGVLLKLTGTSLHGVRYTNYTEADGSQYQVEIKLNSNGNDLSETVTNALDMLGRMFRIAYPGGANNYLYFNNKGQLTNEVDADGVSKVYKYNAQGTLEYSGIDFDGNGLVIESGSDRVIRTLTDYVTHDDRKWRRSSTYSYTTTDSGAYVTNAIIENAIDGHITYGTRFGLTNKTYTYYGGNGARTAYTTNADGSYSISSYQNRKIISVYRYANNATIGGTSYGYDAHLRQNSTTDLGIGTLKTFYYDDADQITNTVVLATGLDTQSTSSFFDSMGRLTRTGLPDGTSVTNEYYTTGELKKTVGSRTYPVQYAYDSQGRMTNMTTWKNFSTAEGAASTTWKYDGYRGFLTNKMYGTVNGPAYFYTGAGRMSKVVWARGVTNLYSYNELGDLINGASVTNGYDRRGRRTSAVQVNTTNQWVLNDAGLPLSEFISGAGLNGFLLTNFYDGLLRRTNLTVLTPQGSNLFSQTYGYDGASRLQTVSDGTNSATYSYLDNSSLISQILYQQNGSTRMTTTKSYDNLNRLMQNSSVPSGGSTLSFGYAYNPANQRSGVTNADSSHWAYNYDKLGQLTFGKKYWQDGSLVAGQQFEYGFDDIGNRKFAASGGNQWGSNLRYANYTANSLNQYTQRTVPGAVDVIGAAHSNATVTVNNTSSYRKGEYFWNEYRTNNSASAKYLWLTNLAVLNDGTNADIIATNIGRLFLPKNPETYTYDADGNLTGDGQWGTMTWNAQGRLAIMFSALSGMLNIWFGYDGQGRRISKTVAVWTNSQWVTNLIARYLYDGWNLIAELDGTNGLVRSYFWGLDLSGSQQGAGGVGGLLFLKDQNTISNQSSAHFGVYDGNGNVVGLVNASSGTNSASYEYSPFGNVLRASGPMAKANPIRFSTKYQDNESDFFYYGYRYYNPSTGRWLSRDPLEEEGGENLYAFVGNNPLNDVDGFGLAGLEYSSEGRAYYNGPWVITGQVDRSYEESGKDKSTSAWFRQTVIANGMGGTCNTGGDASNGSSSFIRARVKNKTSCEVNLECECKINWLINNFSPGSLGRTSFNVNGTVLDHSFSKTYTARRQSNGSYLATGIGEFSEKKTFKLAVGASKDLYFGYDRNATVAGNPGAGFSEYMEGSCSCSTK